MMTDIPKELNSDVIKNTFERAEFTSMPKSEQVNYHKNLKVYRDLVNSFDFAHQEGKEEGIEEGMQKDMEKGEKKKAIEIAKNSLKKGLAIEIIASITQLSIEEIEALVYTQQ